MKKLNTVIFFFLVFTAKAQTWWQSLDFKTNQQTGNSELPCFYNIQKVFKQYEQLQEKEALHENSEKEVEGKFSGYNQFKRWEWFNEQRVYPSGKFPSTELVINEYEKFKAVRTGTSEQGSEITSTGSWTQLASPSVPVGASIGTGRINCMAFMPGNSDVIFVGTAGGGVCNV